LEVVFLPKKRIGKDHPKMYISKYITLRLMFALMAKSSFIFFFVLSPIFVFLFSFKFLFMLCRRFFSYSIEGFCKRLFWYIKIQHGSEA